MVHSSIPLPNFQHGFSTSYALCENYQRRLTHVDLKNHKELGVHKISSRTGFPAVVCPPRDQSDKLQGSSIHSAEDDSPPPTDALEALYPKGSINPSAPIPGGFGFYLTGPKGFVAGKEVVMSYRLMFERDWEWVKGGKLPGISSLVREVGGVGDLAYRCSGGRQENRCKCFNVRLMWRQNGAGELYTYLPLTENNKRRLLAVPPLSRANNDYGFSVGRGSFIFVKARWMCIALRLKMNTVDEEDGELELWIDGLSVIFIRGLSFRDSEAAIIKGMHFQTFFGGHAEDWASPKDQRAWFADVTGVSIPNDSSEISSEPAI
ncbi:polysaccharide lyase family 14 protein [Marasmius fiardii PR-910]|nr:polysaccharide lyase family 14 protein [Marasmius fiardii PR-910]